MPRLCHGMQAPGFALTSQRPDTRREYEQDRETSFDRVVKAMEEAERRNGLLVYMKRMENFDLNE
ncbi:hypothetical protein [Rhizobium sp. S163]|uniref:hypothetical protein n=1 Tax=Rhizobium sp. S163 TaxID=3055039 RepID=UPI0025A9B74B|nr:hypothetical protein [Rhizobium sp. S163]MDM9646786.1 hypothetical protein [Rhizobium sp. S163]